MKELIHFKNQNLNIDYLTLNVPNSIGRILEFAEIFLNMDLILRFFYVVTNESKNIIEDKKLYHTLAFKLKKNNKIDL